MKAITHYVLWFLELASLIIILYCSWALLDTEVFALVAASITLFTSLYLEHRTETLETTD